MRRRRATIGPHESTSGGPEGRPASVSEELVSGGSARSSVAARVGALGALGLALVVVGVLILGGGSSYSLSADFQNASGLVTGDNVLIGPAAVGTISSISLTRNGEARVKMSLHGGVGPMHQGTVARIAEDSLSGIASKYVLLEPGPSEAPTIGDGGVITDTHTYSEVNIDQLFDTFDPVTRAGLSGFIRGEAASLKGRGAQANRALKYLAPGLQTTSQRTAELARDQPTFDQLVVQGANALSALASRSQQLSQLIANTSTATGARTIEALALEARRAEAAETVIAEARTARLRTLWLRTVLFPSLDVSATLPVVGVVLVGGALHAGGLVTVGAVVTATAYLRQLMGPLDTLTRWVEKVQAATASYARVEGLAEGTSPPA